MFQKVYPKASQFLESTAFLFAAEVNFHQLHTITPTLDLTFNSHLIICHDIICQTLFPPYITANLQLIRMFHQAEQRESKMDIAHVEIRIFLTARQFCGPKSLFLC